MLQAVGGLFQLCVYLSPFSCNVYNNFWQMWIEFGRIQLPPGHHPNDIEKEWGKLIVAMLEREKSLRPEVERYEKPRVSAFIDWLNMIESG